MTFGKRKSSDSIWFWEVLKYGAQKCALPPASVLCWPSCARPRAIIASYSSLAVVSSTLLQCFVKLFGLPHTLTTHYTFRSQSAFQAVIYWPILSLVHNVRPDGHKWIPEVVAKRRTVVESHLLGSFIIIDRLASAHLFFDVPRCSCWIYPTFYVSHVFVLFSFIIVSV